MAITKKNILSVLYSISHRLSTSKLWLGKKLGLIRSVIIMPYLGFGNRNELFFLGRVLKDRGISSSKLDDSSWRNFKRMYKRFMTWTIPQAKVEASFDGITKLATTDEEGYFEFSMNLPQPISGHQSWQKIRLELVDEVIKKLGVEMMLDTDTIQAAHHAVSKGWILEEDIADIAEEKKVDEEH